LDALAITQTALKFAYAGHIVAWFCFLFVVHTLNPPQRDVSALVLAVLAVVAVSAIVVGFLMRKKFFTQSTEALPNDPRRAQGLRTSATLIGLSCAMSVTVYGVVLKFLGSSWLVTGIFFAVSLSFLVLWRPREPA